MADRRIYHPISGIILYCPLRDGPLPVQPLPAVHTLMRGQSLEIAHPIAVRVVREGVEIRAGSVLVLTFLSPSASAV